MVFVESIYLSADNPRWSPTSEQDLAAALDHGLLQETHYLELKRELEKGKDKNREHARDLASLAIDGGTLIVGIAEDKAAGVFRRTPQQLAGLRERVEQIARMIPDPPLPVIVRSISSQEDPHLGYLVVHVPASAVAPHMVDHRYLGRGDSTKHYLSDPEVLRLHERRRRNESDVLALLRREFARDPVPKDQQKQAHLFLVAEPLAPRPEMFLRKLHHQDLLALLSKGAWGEEPVRALGDGQHFSPELTAATAFTRRSVGAALSTASLRSDRTVDMTMAHRPEDVLELEVSEDGAVRIMMGRLSAALRGDGDEPVQYLFDQAAVIYVRRLLGLVLEIAHEAGYFGGWGLAVGATGLRGLSSFDTRWYDAQFFEEDVYERATMASYAELVSQPGTVADRLLGRFLRKLGTYPRYSRQLSNPPVPESSSSPL